jgi:hypothetical protein
MNVFISWMPISHVVWVLDVTMCVSIESRIMDSTREQARVEITTLVDAINHRKMCILIESIFIDFVLLDDYLTLPHHVLGGLFLNGRGFAQ